MKDIARPPDFVEILRGILAPIVREEIRAALAESAQAAGQAVYLDVADVAKEIGCHPRTVLRRIRDGELPAVRSGNLIRVRRTDLDAYLAGPR